MPTKRVVVLAVKRSFAILAFVLVAVIVGAYAPIARGTEGTLQASVTVPGPERDAYASAVQACDRCLRAEAATGAPDGESSILFHNGEIELVISPPVLACDRLMVWATGIGWGPAHARAYVSADGKHWREVGRLTLDGEGASGSFAGDFGTVGYVKVVRRGWAFGAVLLDSVWAEGGGN